MSHAAVLFSAYLFLVNLYAFVLCYLDKSFARNHRRRIPEKVLFLSAFLGGGAGFLLGMKRFRHKTKHLSFKILIPLSVLLWIGISLYAFWKMPC